MPPESYLPYNLLKPSRALIVVPAGILRRPPSATITVPFRVEYDMGMIIRLEPFSTHLETLLVFCVRLSTQPMSFVLISPLEYTNEPYAIAKIAGLKMCESFNLQYGTNYIAVMPTNLYGPNDDFDLERSHVLPAMIRKIHLAHCLVTLHRCLR